MRTEIIHEIHLVLYSFKDNVATPVNAKLILGTSDLYKITHCEMKQIELYLSPINNKPTTYEVDFMHDTNKAPYSGYSADAIAFLLSKDEYVKDGLEYLMLPSTKHFIDNCERLLSYDTYVSDIIYLKVSDLDFMNFRRYTELSPFEIEKAIECGALEVDNEDTE